jgi:hypothetical protein
MTLKPGTALAALAALMLAAGIVEAYAADASPGVAIAGTPDKEPPKDCKKKPDDPRCKDMKY